MRRACMAILSCSVLAKTAPSRAQCFFPAGRIHEARVSEKKTRPYGAFLLLESVCVCQLCAQNSMVFPYCPTVGCSQTMSGKIVIFDLRNKTGGHIRTRKTSLVYCGISLLTMYRIISSSGNWCLIFPLYAEAFTDLRSSACLASTIRT